MHGPYQKVGTVMPVVTLTNTQMLLAETVAQKRSTTSLEGGFTDRFNKGMSKEYRQTIDRLGAISELAVSEYLGLEWSGCKGIGLSDVSGFEVRSTQRKDGKDYYLYIRDNDKDGIYVFCVVDAPQVVIAGWSTATKVRKDGRLLYEDTKCYGLPRKDLYPMDLLR